MRLSSQTIKVGEHFMRRCLPTARGGTALGPAAQGIFRTMIGFSHFLRAKTWFTVIRLRKIASQPVIVSQVQFLISF